MNGDHQSSTLKEPTKSGILSRFEIDRFHEGMDGIEKPIVEGDFCSKMAFQLLLCPRFPMFYSSLPLYR